MSLHPSRLSDGHVQIAWGLIDGMPRYIGDFAGLPRGARPEAVCEECGGRLVMRLGQQRARHFAHLSASGCRLSSPEGAEHYNTVRWLAAVLAEAASLRVEERCAADAGCDATHVLEIAHGWDSVAVEKLFHPVRPDLVLMREGQPSAAVEVYNTHEVSREKAAALADRGLAWVEVNAGLEHRGTTPWNPAAPIPARQHGPRSGWLCPRHQRPTAPSVGGAEPCRRTEAPAIAAPDDGWRDIGVRVVDAYHSNGVRQRRLFWLMEQRAGGSVERLAIRDHDREALLDSVRWPTNPGEAGAALTRQLTARFLQWRSHHGTIYDTPMGWADPAELFRKGLPSYFSPERFPPRYVRVPESGHWVLRPEMAGIVWTVQPPPPPLPPQTDLFGG